MFSSAGNRIAKQGRFLKGKDKATRDLFVRHARGNSLFRNQKSSTGLNAFADVSVEAAVTQGRWAWGSAFADLNNDGWQDIVVAIGFITRGFFTFEAALQNACNDLVDGFGWHGHAWVDFGKLNGQRAVPRPRGGVRALRAPGNAAGRFWPFFGAAGRF